VPAGLPGGFGQLCGSALLGRSGLAGRQPGIEATVKVAASRRLSCSWRVATARCCLGRATPPSTCFRGRYCSLTEPDRAAGLGGHTAGDAPAGRRAQRRCGDGARRSPPGWLGCWRPCRPPGHRGASLAGRPNPDTGPDRIQQAPAARSCRPPGRVVAQVHQRPSAPIANHRSFVARPPRERFQPLPSPHSSGLLVPWRTLFTQRASQKHALAVPDPDPLPTPVADQTPSCEELDP
jgi:hypothetical protein